VHCGENDAEPEVAAVCSPCIKICTLDAAGICIGCGRLGDEIARWSGATPQQQRSICEQAAERRAQRIVNYGKR
jgi:uncharacterized protein